MYKQTGVEVDLGSALEKKFSYNFSNTHRGLPLPGRYLLQHQHHTLWTPQWWCSPPQCWAGPSPPAAHGTPRRWRGSFSRWRPPPDLHTHAHAHTLSLHCNLCFDLGPHFHWQLYCHLHEPRPSLSFTLSDTETLSLAGPLSLFSLAQDVSYIFKDRALVSIATENERACAADSYDSDTCPTNLIRALFLPAPASSITYAANASSAVWDKCTGKLQTAVWLSKTRAVRQGLRSEAAVWLGGQRERATELEYVLLVWFVCELEGNV